jgi:hypothetical protein
MAIEIEWTLKGTTRYGVHRTERGDIHFKLFQVDNYWLIFIGSKGRNAAADGITWTFRWAFSTEEEAKEKSGMLAEMVLVSRPRTNGLVVEMHATNR